MYTISRRDLPLAQQAVQAAHAGLEHAYLYGRPPDFHPSYIHLTIRDKKKLEALRSLLSDHSINMADFHEPYQDWGLTAIACCIGEDQRHLLKNLQLWRLPTQPEN